MMMKMVIVLTMKVDDDDFVNGVTMNVDVCNIKHLIGETR